MGPGFHASAAAGCAGADVTEGSGGIWERVVSAGQPQGRAVRGTHGDGVLDAKGMATNADWPRTSGEEAPGMGFRGGAEYFALHIALAYDEISCREIGDRHPVLVEHGCIGGPLGRLTRQHHGQHKETQAGQCHHN